MRFHDSLEGVFSHPSGLRVLRVLSRNPSEALTGREVAARANVSTAQTARALKELEDAGIVSSRATGKAFSWTWNPDHALAGSIGRLFDQEAQIPADLIRELARTLHGLPIEKAILFGSVVRGEERADSDIDLFIETPNAEASDLVRAKLDWARARIWKRYGNPLSPLVMASEEIRRNPRSDLFTVLETNGIRLEL